MSNEIVVQNDTMSVDSVVVQRKKMLEIQSRVMQKGVDYGLVPGCPKPSLFKPGAEKLCATFMIAVTPTVEDLSTEDERKYRVTVNLTHQTTGAFLGAGIGEASTSEKKYKWRKAVCAAEYEATDSDRRKIEFKANGDTIQQVRTEPADLANTVLKMAKKRAQIDAVLTVLGASDLFTQDIEDIPAEYINQGANHMPAARSAKKTEAPAAGPQEITVVVEKYFPSKGKGPHSICAKGIYYKAFGDDGENLSELPGQEVTIAYHVETKGGYTNNMIDGIVPVVAADEPALDAEPVPSEDVPF